MYQLDSSSIEVECGGILQRTTAVFPSKGALEVSCDDLETFAKRLVQTEPNLAAAYCMRLVDDEGIWRNDKSKPIP